MEVNILMTMKILGFNLLVNFLSSSMHAVVVPGHVIMLSVIPSSQLGVVKMLNHHFHCLLIRQVVCITCYVLIVDSLLILSSPVFRVTSITQFIFCRLSGSS